MANFWTALSGTKLTTLQESVTATVALPLSEPLATTQIISGTVPAGMRLKNNQIEGTPYEVSRNTDYKFVVRATYNNQISDRTFIIEVQGADEPEWITDEGLLPIGNNNTYYILDSSPVEFQLLVNDTDIFAGQQLEFFISSGDGVLPPGITLTPDGKLVGIVDPILAIEKVTGSGSYDIGGFDSVNNPYDFGIKSSNGFDSFFYDTTIYDLSIPTRSPKKLNRFYEFIVSCSDGDTLARRKFRIYVVGDDFLRVDNTIMQVGTGIFTADNTHIRTPIWLTPRDFGYRRANNYVTLFLDVIDPNSLSGVVTYTLETTNDDGSPSILPNGMRIDSTTGEIAGRVPYQPSVNQKYTFTVTASRYGPSTTTEFVTIRIYEDVAVGSSQIKIYKNPNIDDLLGLNINIGSGSYTVTGIQTNNQDYDILDIGEPVKVTVYETASVGSNQLEIFKLGRPITETLIGQTFQTGAQAVTISSVDYNETVYKCRQGHSSTSFNSDFGKKFWEAVTGVDLATTAVWTTEQTYEAGDFVKFNNGRSETLTINDTFLVNSYAGFSTDVAVPVLTDAIIKKDSLYEIQTADNFEAEVAASTKTFTVTLLGDVNSEITFITPSNLGNISSNYISTLLVQATSSVRNAKVIYRVADGKLPPGLSLSFDGSINGKINPFGDETKDGLTTFDTQAFTLDGNSTRIDRKFSFTVEARDQFGYSAKEQEFTIVVADPDNKVYSNLFVKPFLKKEKRLTYNEFISNVDIFDPELIYRPNDPLFGVQRNLKMLVYAGLETREIENYVASMAKNHKRRTYRLGEFKTALAKTPGTNDVVYEVVYVEVIDPYLPKKGKANKEIKIQTKNKISVDQSQFGDETKTEITQSIALRAGTEARAALVDGQVLVELRSREDRLIGADNTITLVFRNGTTVDIVGTLRSVGVDDPASFSFRPNYTNVIKVDTKNIDTSLSENTTRYIANLRNMRDNLAEVGAPERNFLPLWMRTAQPGSVQELGFTPAIPLCYCKPGTSATIKNSIDFYNFNFNQFDFDVDRYIIDGTLGNSNEQYLLFANYQFNV